MKPKSTSKHPTLTRLKIIAKRQGSTATTAAELKRWFRAHPIAATKTPINIRLTPNPRFRHKFTEADWLARLAECDKRHATHHPARRRSLERAARQLQVPPVARTEGEWIATKSRIARQLAAISFSLATQFTPPERPKNGCLLDVSKKLYKKLGGKFPCSTKWEFAASWNTTKVIDHNGEWVFADSNRPGYYSRYHAQYWRPGKHKVEMECHAIITPRNHREVTVKAHNSKFVWVLPAVSGLRWDIDLHGLRAVDKLGDDYHPTVDELTSPGAIAAVISSYNLNMDARRAARVEREKNDRAILGADKRGVRVGLPDSLAAGNCREGTESFAKRHRLDVRQWYRPSALLAIANGDAQRVRLAVAMAVRRHDALIAAGAQVFYPH